MTIGQNASRKFRLLTRPSVFLTLLICVTLTACGDDICGTEIPNKAPDKPSNPSPPDSGTASIDTRLDWECSDPEKNPLTYDVYFGTETTPLIVAENESNSIYKPDSLEYETRYNWQIVAKDSEGDITTGPLWTFTTVPQEDLPPYPPSIVWPERNAVDVEVTDSLVWDSSDPNLDPLTHDVLLDIATPPADVVARDITKRSFDPPGKLDYDTRYYWRIVVRDTAGHETAGEIWLFQTAQSQPPSVNNQAPEDGAPDLHPNSIQLGWTASDPDEDPLTFDVLLDTISPPDSVWTVGTTATEFTPIGLHYEKEYFWRVRAKDGFNETLSEPTSFTTRAPVELTIVEGLDTGWSFGVTVDASHQFAYVASRTRGLVFVFADPYDGSWITDTYNPGDGFDVFWDVGRVYLAAGMSGLHMVTDDPWMPEPMDSLGTSMSRAITVSGDVGYLTAAVTLWILDVSEPDTIAPIVRYDPPESAGLMDVTVNGDYAYLVDTGNGLHIVDISDPSNPWRVGGYDPGSQAYQITVAGGVAYLAACRLYVIDISDPSEPTVIQIFETQGRAGSVAIDGDYAYVGSVWNVSELEVVDISVLATPRRAAYADTPHFVRGIAFDDNYIYLACDDAGFQVIRKSPLD